MTGGLGTHNDNPILIYSDTCMKLVPLNFCLYDHILLGVQDVTLTVHIPNVVVLDSTDPALSDLSQRLSPHTAMQMCLLKCNVNSCRCHMISALVLENFCQQESHLVEAITCIALKRHPAVRHADHPVTGPAIACHRANLRLLSRSSAGN